MSETFPPEIRQFVQQELAKGNYQSEEELVLVAVRFLRDSNLRIEQLREGLKTRLDGLDRGLGMELEDEESLGTFFDQIEAEVDQELAPGRKPSE